MRAANQGPMVGHGGVGLEGGKPGPMVGLGGVGGNGMRATRTAAREEAASAGASPLSLRRPFQMAGNLDILK